MMEKRIYRVGDGLEADLRAGNERAAVKKRRLRDRGWEPSVISLYSMFFNAWEAPDVEALVQAAREIATAWDHDPEAALADLQETEGA